MKQCPICQSWAFDDSETCYGCLHRFTAKDAEITMAAQPEEPPGFVITIKPEHNGSGVMSWKCSVDLVPCAS